MQDLMCSLVLIDLIIHIHILSCIPRHFLLCMEYTSQTFDHVALYAPEILENAIAHSSATAAVAAAAGGNGPVRRQHFSQGMEN